MSPFFNKFYNSKTRVFWHAAFWTVFLLAHTIFYGSQKGDYAEEFYLALGNLPFKMAVTYFVLYYVIPKYILRKKYARAVLAFVFSLGVAVLIQQSINYVFIFPVFHPEWEAAYLFYTSKMFNVFLGMYPVVTIAASIKLVKHWYQKDHQARELKQQKLEAELMFLKAQTHPHFLFNTLNNLYALTLKKSDDASEVVLKLSELLNYVLYECNEPAVPLERELDLIRNYISLEQIRYGSRLDVSLNVTGDTTGKQIPPMLILPFVENSFKHGVSLQLEEAWVNIDVRIEDDKFYLNVENSRDPAKEEMKAQNYRDGIGLENVQRRLELLYDSRYRLDVNGKPDRFSVSLVLNLNHQIEQEIA